MLRKEYIIRDMREEMKLTEVESVKTFDAIQEVFREELEKYKRLSLEGIGTMRITVRKGRTYKMPDDTVYIIPDKTTITMKGSKDMLYQLNKKEEKENKYYYI